MKDWLKKTRRLRILKSELNAKNKIKATADFAVPVLRHNFCITNWRFEQIRRTNRRSRNTQIMY